jgi:hypothetical protein
MIKEAWKNKKKKYLEMRKKEDKAENWTKDQFPYFPTFHSRIFRQEWLTNFWHNISTFLLSCLLFENNIFMLFLIAGSLRMKRMLPFHS